MLKRVCNAYPIDMKTPESFFHINIFTLDLKNASAVKLLVICTVNFRFFNWNNKRNQVSSIDHIQYDCNYYHSENIIRYQFCPLLSLIFMVCLIFPIIITTKQWIFIRDLFVDKIWIKWRRNMSSYANLPVLIKHFIHTVTEVHTQK